MLLSPIHRQERRQQNTATKAIQNIVVKMT
ncbi:hypothetical protein CIPAW_14G074100 [Carya illinoinensis]|uniref:Uncharacterized protein n=1 Tax=Carya illinoinensis TaxID=32201 RepID=A0A8T1NKG0_CARIL|nr:hypothetical protein CIPAW_14G074100 [Carya illinoinensis]